MKQGELLLHLGVRVGASLHVWLNVSTRSVSASRPVERPPVLTDVAPYLILTSFVLFTVTFVEQPK